MNQRFCITMKSMAVAIFAISVMNTAYASEASVAADAYVNSNYPSVNFGALSNLYVSSAGTALLKFDLSSVPAGTLPGQVGKATLRLYVNRINTSGSVVVLPVTSAWTESSVTYNVIPALGSQIATFTPAVSSQFITIDVTSLVQGWLTTPAGNFGLALSSSIADVVFDSKENVETGHAAQLDITLSSAGVAGTQDVPGPAGPTGPAGPIGATGATGTPGLPARKALKAPLEPMEPLEQLVRLAHKVVRARPELPDLPVRA